MIKQILLFSLLLINGITNTKFEHLENRALVKMICDTQRQLAMLNNTSSKLKLTSYMMIDPFDLYLFVDSNTNNDPDINEFKKIKNAFNDREDIHEQVRFIAKYYKHQAKKIKKIFKNENAYNEIIYDRYKKEHDASLQEEINKLNPESKELFDKSSQLLDKICEKYPEKIENFKKRYENELVILHNELLYRKHNEKTTNLIHELTTHQYQ